MDNCNKKLKESIGRDNIMYFKALGMVQAQAG